MVVGMYWPDFVVAVAATNHAIDDCSLAIECLAKSMVMYYCVAAIVQPFDRRSVYAPVFAYVHDYRLDFDDQNRLPLDFDDQMNGAFAVTEMKTKFV